MGVAWQAPCLVRRTAKALVGIAVEFVHVTRMLPSTELSSAICHGSRLLLEEPGYFKEQRDACLSYTWRTLDSEVWRVQLARYHAAHSFHVLFPSRLIILPWISVAAAAEAAPVEELSDETKAALVKQVEFYFSDENLPTDAFMKKKVKAGGAQGGWNFGDTPVYGVKKKRENDEAAAA